MLPIRADMESAPTKGYGLCPMCPCNTKAKLAIKQHENKNLNGKRKHYEKKNN